MGRARARAACAPVRRAGSASPTAARAARPSRTSGGNEAPEDAFVRGLAEARGEGAAARELRRRARARASGAASAPAAAAPRRRARARPAPAARKPAPAARRAAGARRRKPRRDAAAGEAPEQRRPGRRGHSRSARASPPSRPACRRSSSRRRRRTRTRSRPPPRRRGTSARGSGSATPPRGPAPPRAGATVAVLYTCRLHATNKRVDHRSNPNSPFTFILAAAPSSRVWIVPRGMAVGGERELVVPAHLVWTAGAAEDPARRGLALRHQARCASATPRTPRRQAPAARLRANARRPRGEEEAAAKPAGRGRGADAFLRSGNKLYLHS